MLSISIQAGGQSTRMGTNKALINFGGVPLIQHMFERLRPLSEDIFITTNTPDEFPPLQARFYKDVHNTTGALSGLVTALHYAKNETVAVIACDMPFIMPALITAEYDLLSSLNMDVVIPRTVNGLEPLLAVYRVSTCLPAATSALLTGQKRMISFFNAVKVQEMGEEIIKRYDPDLRSFFNINTVDDLEQALRKRMDMD